MCAVSVIYDMFSKMPDSWYDRKERFDLFYKMKDLAFRFDLAAGQPDCEDSEKAKLLDRIFELENQLKSHQ